MKYRKLYEQIASLIQARENCIKANNAEWKERHSEALENIEKNYLPSGSGIDSGSKILIDECKPNLIVLFVEFHHMNENGFYDGWTEHKLFITPSLTNDFDIRITGRNRNDIKDYLSECYNQALYSEDYSIDSLFDTLLERYTAKLNKLYPLGLLKGDSEYIKSLKPFNSYDSNNIMHIHCLGEEFKNWQSAKLASIEAMEALTA
jgi:hypothetical protein